MKKSIFLLMLLIVLIPNVLAQNIQNITDFSSNFSLNKLKSTTNEAINKEIEIPGWAEIIAKIFFGVENKIKLSTFIVLACIWLMFFLMILNIVRLMPLFKGIGKWIASLAITLLIAISGVILNLSEGILNFALSFSFFKNWSAGALFFIVLIILVVFFVIIKILNKLKEKVELESAETNGEEAGQGLSIMRVVSRAFTKR